MFAVSSPDESEKSKDQEQYARRGLRRGAFPSPTDWGTYVWSLTSDSPNTARGPAWQTEKCKMIGVVLFSTHFRDTEDEDQTTLIRDERIVVGYHGTSADRAESVLSSGGFVPSRNDYDWLGHGIYFWEHAPLRAWQWATRKYGKDAAVLECNIVLGYCLDLSDIRYTSALRLAYDSLREAYIKTSTTLPSNRNKARTLDCLVINYFTTVFSSGMRNCQGTISRRRAHLRGRDAAISSHIQLVVRQEHCLLTAPRLTGKEVINGTELQSHHYPYQASNRKPF